MITVSSAKGTSVFPPRPGSRNEVAWNAAEVLLEATTPSDSYEAEHARAVFDLSRQLGVEFGLDERALETLALGALLHDVGKNVVPEAVMRKPGPLTRCEWGLMKRHPEVGERMAESVGCLRMAAPVIRHHHERYDGGGYPDALSGEEIPLAARIVAAADAYDSMVRGRPYAGARPPTEAVRELIGEARGQFDPQVVAALARMVG